MNHETAKEIEIAIAQWFGYRDYVIVPNVSWGFLTYEADLLVISSSGYAWEVEIKISRGDLVRDKNKRHSHESRKVRKLWFAIPEKLSNCIEHVPERAGVLIVSTDGIVRELRKPTVNEFAIKLTDAQQFQVARLGAMRVWDLKKRIVKSGSADQQPFATDRASSQVHDCDE
jgi:hypothetical protein